MLKLFRPDYYIKSYQQLDPEVLRKKGIKLLICDIDNTLVGHDDPEVTAEVRQFATKIEKAGIELVLISNNTVERARAFAQQLQVAYYGFAKKPFRITYQQVLKDYKLQNTEIASLGDQLLTDVLGSRRMGFFTILADPLYSEDNNYTKVNRLIERLVYKCLRSQGYLRKGEYYD